MAPPVKFVDTSVLCNILEVPGRDQHRDDVLCALRALLEEGAELIVPTAAVIETGNHISQINDGGVRRKAAERFEKMLRHTIAETAPWKFNNAFWDAAFIAELCDGGGTGTSLTAHATAGDIGVGDLTILAEADQYRRRSRLADVTVWTLDAQLDAHNPA